MSDYNKGSLNEPCLRLPYGSGEEVALVELGDGTGYVRLSDWEELKAENAKLRELLKNALTYIEYEGCGVECPETGNSATLTSCDMCNRYETESCAYVIAQNARELGIEVEK